jgi:transposase
VTVIRSASDPLFHAYSQKNCFSPYLYRDRNAIERMFCRLKDFRRVATRYDRLAVNYLAAVLIAATLAYWL